jgi:hypothetical protein
MTEWHKYGQLQSPMQRLGLDKMLYNEDKKKELFTDTKNYVTKRNDFLQNEMKKIDDEWLAFMKRGEKDGDLFGIPISERTALADRLAVSKKTEIAKIADDLWPNADLGYKQQANLNTAQNIVEGNIVAKAAPKKRGRKANAAPKMKAEKVPAMKRGRPKKAAK